MENESWSNVAFTYRFHLLAVILSMFYWIILKRLCLFFFSIAFCCFFLNILADSKKSVLKDGPWKSAIEHISDFYFYFYLNFDIDWNMKDFFMLFTFHSFAVRSSVSLKIWLLLPSLSESCLLKAKKFDYLTDCRNLIKILSWEFFFFDPSHPTLQELIGSTEPLTLRAMKKDPAIMDINANTINDMINRNEEANAFWKLAIKKSPNLSWLRLFNWT